MAKAFEVYVHVPFCLRRCGYCDFNTYTARDLGGGASRQEYAHVAMDEMRIVHEAQQEHESQEPQVSTVFFGGGTPTVLPARDLAAMLNTIRALWGIAPDAEITTEANPDTVDDAYIAALADAGFTRISFGMQSAVPHVLRTLDRTHTASNVVQGVQAAQRYGLEASVDLIYGAPGESIEDWRCSVQTALDLGVQHLSAYALTVEPTTKMGRQIAAGILPKPNDDDEAAKYEIVDELCAQAGLSWYEISNWALPGHESRHNIGYWHNIDWAGIGPGAHSHYQSWKTQPDEPALGLRAWDTPHPRAWAQQVANHMLPWQGSEIIHPHEHLEETIMLGLRLREGLDLNTVRALTSRDINPLVTSLVDDELVTLNDNRIVATQRGRLLNDTIIERFFDAVFDEA